jgi:hypothetical protein
MILQYEGVSPYGRGAGKREMPKKGRRENGGSIDREENIK